jgi:hypothetical protein
LPRFFLQAAHQTLSRKLARLLPITNFMSAVAARLNFVPKVITGGWEMLVMSSINSGAPFTVYSGIQQTGAGSNGVDRPNQIAKPQLSTARKDRTDYFGHGGGNGPDYFSIVHRRRAQHALTPVR